MIAVALLACGGPAELAGDEAFAVTASRPAQGPAVVAVETRAGWHLNRDYPSRFDAAGGAEVPPFVVVDDTHGHQDLPAVAGAPVEGTFWVGFCNADRCRIEQVTVHL